jgi:replicative DNA helicase
MPRKTVIREDGLPDVVFERGLPSNVEAERSILGAILLDNAAYDEAEIITYNDFALESHQRLFHAIAGLIEDGHAVDIVTLAEDLHSRKEADAVGGVAYIASLTEGLPRRLSIDEYVRIVKDKSQLRRTINVCSLAITQAADQSMTADEVLTETDIRLLEISADSANEPVPLSQSCMAEFDKIVEERDSRQPAIGVPSGLPILDEALGGGWGEGELAIVAGKPGLGKSSLAVQTVVECGRRMIPAHFFQLEMTLSQVLRRMWACMTGIKIGRLQHAAYLSQQEIELLAQARQETARFPLVIDTNAYLTKQQIISRARISKRRYGTRFVAVDYLQKLRFESKAEFRHIEVGDTAKLLATFAKNEHVAVMALSSLTDKSGRAADAEPTLADLRQSGDIQYEASTVLFVHRVHIERRGLDPKGQLIIGKQRNGVTGSVPVVYNACSVFDADPEAIADQPQQIPMVM